jgi:DNA-binding MarR family transcriptional regulator
MDSATITGLIDRLQAAKLIERRPDESDRRVNRVFLTPQGSALQQPLVAVMAALNAEVDQQLGEWSPTLRQILRQLAQPQTG